MVENPVDRDARVRSTQFTPRLLTKELVAQAVGVFPLLRFGGLADALPMDANLNPPDLTPLRDRAAAALWHNCVTSSLHPQVVDPCVEVADVVADGAPVADARQRALVGHHPNRGLGLAHVLAGLRGGQHLFCVALHVSFCLFYSSGTSTVISG